MGEQQGDAVWPPTMLKALPEWIVRIVGATGAIAALLIDMKVPRAVAFAIAVALLAIATVAADWLRRRRVRQERAAAKSDNEQVAFRGLRSYHRDDRLPGHGRRALGATILQDVQQSHAHISVLSGESGAGKSSLLECAVAGPLEKAGYIVIQVADLNRQLLAVESPMEPQAHLASLFERIRAEVDSASASPNLGVVLIFDQFEELLARLRDEELRLQMCSHLRVALDVGRRIVISIRKEFYQDMWSLAAHHHLQQRMPEKFLFELEDFEPADAKDVIRECADVAGVTYDPGLPAAIVRDLAPGGRVRPPDLQIVCAELGEQLTLERYESRGGANGLRSSFIRRIMDRAGDTNLRRAVLRGLCDIPKSRRLITPVTAAEIATQAQNGAAGKSATESAVTEILTALEDQYIVVRIRGTSGDVWSLIHDYLVEPIKMATEDRSARSEAAVAELGHYMSLQRGLVPLDRLRQIRRDAPPMRLEDPAARRLIRRSYIVGYGRPVAAVSVVAVVFVVLAVALLTKRNIWRPVSALSHWEISDGRFDGLEAFPVNNATSRFIAIRASAKAAARVGWDGDQRKPSADDAHLTISIWNTENGKRVAAYRADLLPPPPTDGYLWAIDRRSSEIVRVAAIGGSLHRYALPEEARMAVLMPPSTEAVRTAGGGQHAALIIQNPLLDEGPMLLALSPSSKDWTLIRSQDVLPARGIHERRMSNSGVLPPSIVTSRSVCAMLGTGMKEWRLTVRSADMQRALADEIFRTSPRDVFAGSAALLPVVERGGEAYVSTLIRRKLVKVLSVRQDSLPGGSAPVGLRAEPIVDVPLPLGLRVPADGASSEEDPYQEVLVAGDKLVFIGLARTRIWPFEPASGQFLEPHYSPTPAVEAEGALLWGDTSDGSTMIWLLDRPVPIPMHGMKFHSKDEFIIAAGGERLLRRPEKGVPELWSIGNGKTEAGRMLAKIDVRMPTGVMFSNDDKLVIARQEGGALFAWTTNNGASLGQLGTVGSAVIWSTYDAACERVFVWTSEGERLDWRRGDEYPVYGFRPRGRCS
jgi:hypothetical protein